MPAGARGRGQAADRATARRDAGRRRAGDRVRPDRAPAPTRAILHRVTGTRAGRRALRRGRQLGPDRGVRPLRGALDGRGADGVRGRGRAAARRGGLRDVGASTPLYFAQAIGRFVRTRRPWRDGVDVRAQRPGAVAAGQRAGGAARPRARQAAAPGGDVERRGAERGQPAGGRAGGAGQGVHVPGRRRRAGPADLRGHRRTPPTRRTTWACRGCWSRSRCGRC